MVEYFCGVRSSGWYRKAGVIQQAALDYIAEDLQAQPLLSSHLPRHRTALHDPRHLSPKLAVDNRPPRDQRELVALLDDGEFAAAELNRHRRCR